MRMTFRGTSRRRRWPYLGGSRQARGQGARSERLLENRLVEVQRRLDNIDKTDARAVDAWWAEYYLAFDLWWRARAPRAAPPPLTMSMLKERFAQPRR